MLRLDGDFLAIEIVRRLFAWRDSVHIDLHVFEDGRFFACTLLRTRALVVASARFDNVEAVLQRETPLVGERRLELGICESAAAVLVKPGEGLCRRERERACFKYDMSAQVKSFWPRSVA